MKLNTDFIKSIYTRQSTQIVLVVIICFITIVVFSLILPPAIDWHKIYRPAAVALIKGHSPFDIDRFSNAPWALLPMLPLLLVPENVGRAISALCALVTFAYVAHRFGGKPVAIVFFLLSPPVIQSMLDGNLDWLAAIGFVLPPQIGLFFVLMKPQIGIAVVVFWLIQSLRRNGIREAIRVFAPISLTLIASFVIFGLWPLGFSRAFSWGGNASLWPMSIPVGLALSVSSIRRRRIEYAIAASPCLSPYVLLHSWYGPLLAIVSLTPEIAAAVIGMWILVGIRAAGY